MEYNFDEVGNKQVRTDQALNFQMDSSVKIS